MKSDNKAETANKPRKHKPTKRILIVAAIILLALILIVGLVIPAFVSSESGRKAIIAKINSSLKGKTDIASLSMGWFSGVRLTDLSFDDNAGQTFIRIKQIQTKPHYASILTGNLSFGRTVVDQPQVHIYLQETVRPQSVYQGPGIKHQESTVAMPVSRINLLINNGSLRITDAKANTVELQRINSSLNLKGPDRMNSFTADMVLADSETTTPVHADGAVNPKKISGNLTVEVNDLQLESLESFFALAGVDLQSTGRLSGKIAGAVKNGSLQKLNARLKGKDIKITGKLLKGDTFKTSTLSITSAIQRRENFINIAGFDINTDWLHARASGDVPVTYKSFEDFIKAKSGQGLKAEIRCDIAKLASQMPRLLGVRQDTTLTSGTLTANIEKNNQPALLAQAKLDGLSGIISNKPVRLSQPIMAEAKITSDAKKIRFEKLNLKSSFANLDCSGTSDLLQYSANINLASLQSELGQFLNLAGYQMAGDIESNGRVEAMKKKFQLTGSSLAKNLSITSPKQIRISEPAATAGFTMDIEPDASLLSVKLLQINAAFGRVDIRDSVIPLKKEASGRLSLNVVAKALNLARVMLFAELFTPAARDIRLSGLAEAEFIIKPDKDGYSIHTDSTQIANFEFAFKDKQPFRQDKVSVKLDSRIEPAKLTAKGSLTCPEISIGFDVEKKIGEETTRLKGAADLDYKWSAISDFASQFLPSQLKLQGQRKGKLTFTSNYPTTQPEMLWANLTAKAPKIGFDRAEYMGLIFEPVEVDVQVQNGVLQIAPFTAKVNNGQLNFAASANFNDELPILKTPGPVHIAKNVQIDDKTTKQFLTFINPIFANTSDVSGTADFYCETLAIPLKGGTARQLELVGTFSLENVKMRPSGFLGALMKLGNKSPKDQMITVHPTKIVVRNALLSYDNMQIDIGDNPFNFVGRVNLESKSLEGSKVVTPYTFGDTIRVGGETSGRRITAHIKGAVNRPELDVGKTATDALIQWGLEELLKNK